MNEINEKTKSYVMKCCAVVFGVCAAMIFIKFNDYDDFMKTTEAQIEKLKYKQSLLNHNYSVSFNLNEINENTYKVVDSLDNNFKFAFYIVKLEKFAGGTKVTFVCVPLSQSVIGSLNLTVFTNRTQKYHTIKDGSVGRTTTVVIDQNIDAIESISIKDIHEIKLSPMLD